MTTDAGYVRKALRAAQDELITEIDWWDPVNADALILDEWLQRLAGLESMIARAMQETEIHRRQIMVIKSEMQAFERSANATKILDPGASRGIAAQADLMSKDLAAANETLSSIEAEEARLRQAAEIASKKITDARERLSSLQE